MTSTRPTDRSVYADGTPTAPVVIVGPNLPEAGPTFHVHTAGCADRRRAIYRSGEHQDAWDDVIEVRDVRDVVDCIYFDGGSFYTESGWEGQADGSVTEDMRNETAWVEYRGDFKFFPCVDLPDDVGGLRHTTTASEATS